MRCFCCNQEMTDPATDSCEHDRDITYGDGPRCPDCNVMPGGTHHCGCDQELCSICHIQVIVGCAHSVDVDNEAFMHNPENARWAPETL